MKTVVVGGGAAGMLAAYFSAKGGAETILIEKNEKTGKKLYITGKGRCNVTNDCEKDEFLSNVISNSRFMTGAYYSFTAQDMMELLENNGLQLKIERGNRVFPASDKSSDVIRTLGDMCKKAGVEIRLNEEVEKITVENGAIAGVFTNLGEYPCDNVILATGGISYPSTGSTGDGYKLAKKLGHKIIPPIQALVPFKIKGDYCSKLSGLSLKNVALNVFVNGKKAVSEFGEMLFTHQGVSGPIVLTASSIINRAEKSAVTMSIDLKPALSEQQLDARVLRDFGELKNRSLKNSLDRLLPLSLIPIVIERTGISPMKKNSEITKAERQKLLNAVKNFALDYDGLASFNEAVVTAGGIDVKEINPKTMESKLVKGLYFAGEVMDVDALTGGFNLQVAFSTGAKAGICSAKAQ